MPRVSGGPLGRGSALRGVAGWTPWSLSGTSASKLTWLRGDLGVTTASAHLTGIVDQFGVAGTYSAPGAQANQPVQQACAAAAGQLGIYFDGNDKLSSSAAVLPAAGSYTVATVHAFDDTTARVLIDASAGNDGTRYAQNVSGSSKRTVWNKGVAFVDDSAAVAVPESWVASSTIGANSGDTLYVNGVSTALTGGAASLTSPTGVLTIGQNFAGTQAFKGYLLELVITSTRWTAADISAWEAYTLKRYGF